MTVPAMIGATTLLADGIITPPITVSSAIEGLGMVNGLEEIIVPGNKTVIYMVIAILSILFFMQRFGTQKLEKPSDRSCSFGLVCFW